MSAEEQENSQTPSQSIPVILIEEDPDVRFMLRECLIHLKYVDLLAETDSLIYGYELVRQNHPRLVFIDLRSDNLEASLRTIERISTYQKGTMIFATGQDLSMEGLVACMQAGVREYITRPIDPDMIVALIERHKEELLVDKESGDKTGRIITVFSNKGGLGKTTVAVNLAVALSEVTEKPVAVVDLNLQLGDVTTFLDIQPKQTIVDIARNLARVDRTYLENSLALYENANSRVFVMADPMQVEEGEEVSAAQINSILTIMKSSFEYVVVDTTTSFDAKTLTALDLADSVLLTSIINLPCIRSTQRVLTLFDRLGYDRTKIKLLINRYIPDEEITLEDVTKTLEHPIYWTVPNNYMTVMTSINRGIPIASIDPTAPVWANFKELAYELTGLIRPQQTGPDLPLAAASAKSKTKSSSLLEKFFQRPEK